jgi:hypothetical protein
MRNGLPNDGIQWTGANRSAQLLFGGQRRLPPAARRSAFQEGPLPSKDRLTAAKAPV